MTDKGKKNALIALKKYIKESGLTELNEENKNARVEEDAVSTSFFGLVDL